MFSSRIRRRGRDRPTRKSALVSSPSRRRLPARLRQGGVRVEALMRIAANVVMRIGRDNLMLVSAGVAFYAMTAIFPAIAAFVSIYGLFADPHAVQGRVAEYADLLPASSLRLLTDALQNFVSKSNS